MPKSVRMSVLGTPQISEWCGIFAAIGGGALVLAVLQQWGFARMGQCLTRRLRVLLLASIFRQARSPCLRTAAAPL